MSKKIFSAAALLTLFILAAIFVPALSGKEQQTAVFAEDEDEDEKDERTITVSGSASINAAPEKVEVYLSIETDNALAGVSQEKNAEVSAKVIAGLKAMGISASDIETTSYSLQEMQEWNEVQRKYLKTGYRTAHSLKVSSTDTTVAGKIIDSAVQNGANRVDTVAFSLKDETIDALKLDALKLASAKSIGKAEALASGAGVQIVELKSMNESYVSYVPFYNKSYAYDAGVAESGAPTEVIAGEIKVTAEIQATYTIQ
ncbi:MAG: SIMPL domain-containing protein [Candidatus Diapherotrites archaeon]|nr:SIMPL domain-containing protein [Candidatus Diapherotrites archaeon]